MNADDEPIWVYMYGPEHYREADTIIDDLRSGHEKYAAASDEDIRGEIAIAQVHATLALAWAVNPAVEKRIARS